MPATRTAAAPQVGFGEGGFDHQVGGHDGAGGVFEARRRKARHQPRQGGGDLGAVHFHADHASGCGEHLRHRQLENLGGRARGGQRHGVAGARGAVGVAGIHQNGADAALRQRQMAAAQPDRRRLHAVAREHGGGGGVETGDDQRQIVTLGLPYSGVHGRISISQGQIQTDTSPKASSIRTWRTHSCVPRRHSCRRRFSVRQQVSRRVSTHVA
jgi:hypothetical protein